MSDLRSLTILVTVDGLRYSDLIDGSRQIRHKELTKMAEDSPEASVFHRFYTCASTTQMAFPGIFCGGYPLTQGGYNFGIRDRGHSFVQDLADQGICCAAFNTDFEAGCIGGYHRGFELYEDLFDIGWMYHAFVSVDLNWARRRPALTPTHRAILSRKLHILLQETIEVSQNRVQQRSRYDARCDHLFSWDFAEVEYICRNEMEKLRQNPDRYLLDAAQDHSGPLDQLAALRVSPYYADADVVFENCERFLSSRKPETAFVWANLSDVHGVIHEDLQKGCPIRADYESLRELPGCSRVRERYPGHATRNSTKVIEFLLQNLEAFWTRVRRDHPGAELDLLLTSDHGMINRFRAHHKQYDNLFFFEEQMMIPMIILSNRKEGHRDVFELHCNNQVGDFVKSRLIETPPPRPQEFIYHENNGPGPVFIEEKDIRLCIHSNQLKMTFLSDPAGNTELTHAFDLHKDPWEDVNLVVHGGLRQDQKDQFFRIAAERCREIRRWSGSSEAADWRASPKP